MSECDKGVSRRTVLLAVAAAPALALMTTAAQAKMAQAAAKYQTEPKEVNGEKRQCDGCNFFVGPNSCKMVDGEISPTGWCQLWVKKAA